MMLLRATSSQILNVSEDRTSTNSLGSLLQYLTTLLVKTNQTKKPNTFTQHIFASIYSVYLNLYILGWRANLHMSANN